MELAEHQHAGSVPSPYAAGSITDQLYAWVGAYVPVSFVEPQRERAGVGTVEVVVTDHGARYDSCAAPVSAVVPEGVAESSLGPQAIISPSPDPRLAGAADGAVVRARGIGKRGGAQGLVEIVIRHQVGLRRYWPGKAEGGQGGTENKTCVGFHHRLLKKAVLVVLGDSASPLNSKGLPAATTPAGTRDAMPSLPHSPVPGPTWLMPMLVAWEELAQTTKSSSAKGRDVRITGPPVDTAQAGSQSPTRRPAGCRRVSP